MRYLPVITTLLILSCSSTSNLQQNPKVWTYEEALELRQRQEIPFITQKDYSWVDADLDCDPSFSFFPFYKEGFQEFGLTIRYPTEDRLNNVTGELKISYIVNVHGYAEDVRVVQSLSSSIDTQVKRNIQRAEYVPGFCNKEVQPARHLVTMKFSLTPPVF